MLYTYVCFCFLFFFDANDFLHSVNLLLKHLSSVGTAQPNGQNGTTKMENGQTEGFEDMNGEFSRHKNTLKNRVDLSLLRGDFEEFAQYGATLYDVSVYFLLVHPI